MKTGTIFAEMGLSNDSRLQEIFPSFLRSKSYFVRFRADQATIFRSEVRSSKRRVISENSLFNLTHKKFTGVLSKKTRQKMVDICDSWLETIEIANNDYNNSGKGKKRALVMLTLTLSSIQRHDDREIKRSLLIPFIQLLIKRYGNLNYLWKAESQKNGNIHFHLLLDSYIDKDEVLLLWNHVQDYLGYVRVYKEKNENKRPTSTRIEQVSNKMSGIRYVAKYIMKEENNRKIKGRLWGCNRALSQLIKPEYSITSEDLMGVIRLLARTCSNTFHNNHCIVMNDCWIDHKVFNILNKKDLHLKIARHNYDLLYSITSLYPDEIMSESWQVDVIKEFSPINSSYLFNNDYFGEVKDKLFNY